MWSIVDIFVKGGIAMYPIALCSVLLVAFCIEKVIYLRRVRIDVDNLMARIRASIEAGKVMEAIAICEANPTPMANLMRAALKKADTADRALIREAIEDAASLEMPRIERFIPEMATIGSVTPLLGLLGTIFGMIRAFNVIAVQGTGDPHAMAGGISEALISTAAGLIVAIPAVALYRYFQQRVNSFITDMESRSSEVLDLVSSKDISKKKAKWDEI
ncbi:MAG: MotA/TolQ/ExbB proton channel family protein [Spirochaetes bacterium]|nr:MotA/TolQ/ExbB proton channel family protein [Spirochaetota bacterium]